MLVVVAGVAADPSAWAAAALSVDAAQATAPQNLGTWSGGALATWEELVTAVATSGTYALAPGFSMQGFPGGRGLTLRKGVNVTILGQGAVLDASSRGQFFLIETGASLTLKDLTLRHGANTEVSGRHSCMPHSHTPTGGRVVVFTASAGLQGCTLTFGVCACACRMTAEPSIIGELSRPAAATSSATQQRR
jgi:hypothetical protein